MRTTRISIALVLLAAACSKKEPAPPQQDPAPSPEAAPPVARDHGDAAPIGRIVLAGHTFEIARLGTLEPGTESAVTARATAAPQGADWRKTNLYVWAEDAGGGRLTAPSKAIVEAGKLHLHVALPQGSAPAAALVFRLRQGDTDERARLALAGAPPSPKAEAPKHTHEATPHDGIVARLGDPGWLELKLHDDKGDLELWLTKDPAGKEPLDLPLGARPRATFVDHEGREVTLAPRNTDQNEDEDGTPTVRDGKTNYFIFPGASGEDASWLKGAAFLSIVTVKVEVAGAAVTSAELVLQPHTHAHGDPHQAD